VADRGPLRSTRPSAVPSRRAPRCGSGGGGVKPRSCSSSRHRAARSAPVVGVTLSGRAYARRSHIRRSRRPGSCPGCSARHAASYRSVFRAICCGAGTEPAGIRGELGDLTRQGVEVVAAGVDLEVQVPVRVPRLGRVVPHHGRLEPVDGDLHLSAPRPDPGGGVRGEPPDDLPRRLLLRGVVGVGDIGVLGRGQGPGSGSVDDDLDEPQSPLVGPQPTLRAACVDVVPGDPPLIRRPLQRPPSVTLGGGPRQRRRRRTGWPGRCPRQGSRRPRGTGRPRRSSGPRPASRGRTSPAMHPAPPPVTARQPARKRRSIRPHGRTDSRTS
jgi:hypothetical protein